MRSITRLFSAFGTLADSLIALASVVNATTGRLQHTIAAEDASHVIEHQTAGEKGFSPDPDPAPTGKRGKGKGAA
jgi:hypothetical protein